MKPHKLLYTADRVRAMFARMRGELEAQHSRHLCEYASLRRELDALRAAYEALCGAVLEREKAEATVDNLRAVQRAVDEKRDSVVTVH
jgi:hypothetical protein